MTPQCYVLSISEYDMLNIDRLLNKFVRTNSGEFLITDTQWKLLYRSHTLSFDDEQWEKWILICKDEPEPEPDWEIVAKDTGRYYKVKTVKISDDGQDYLVHHVFDISDYAKLFRELSIYSSEWRSMSECQRDIIGNLSGNCSACLPIAQKYLKARTAILYIKRNFDVVRYILDRNSDGNIKSDSVDKMPEEIPVGQNTCSLPGLGENDYICCCYGKTVSGAAYGLYIASEGNVDISILPMYCNEFRLFLENSLLREQIIYENEHDHLTGLYNKGKLMELSKNLFPFCDSIAVFNMDVNYLKRTNDMFGHEAGDHLIIKAADSIRAISGPDVYGFRTGGDEFVVIAVNVSEEQAGRIKADWEKALDELNKKDTEFECIIACGLGFGTKPFDLEKISGQADSLMYEDKRNIKIQRGEDPDAR